MQFKRLNNFFHLKKSNLFLLFCLSGKTVDGGVITLPSHFKVDDPESTIGYDANFGRRIPQNPPSIQQVNKKNLPYKNRTSSELEEVTARDRSKT